MNLFRVLFDRMSDRYNKSDNPNAKMAADLALIIAGLSWLTVPGNLPEWIATYIPTAVITFLPLFIGLISVVASYLKENVQWTKASWLMLAIALLDAAAKLTGDWPHAQELIAGAAVFFRTAVGFTVEKKRQPTDTPPTT